MSPLVDARGRAALKENGKSRAVLAAVRAGCQTAREVEAELDGAMTPHLIAGHLSNLRRRGLIVRVGTIRYHGSGHACAMYRTADDTLTET